MVLIERLAGGGTQAGADTAYDSQTFPLRVKQLRAKACIRPNLTRKKTQRYLSGQCKRRNAFKRFFGRIKRYRRVHKVDHITPFDHCPTGAIAGRLCVIRDSHAVLCFMLITRAVAT